MNTVEYIKDLKTDQGVSIYDSSQEGPVMMVFLRHFGCVFCREALKHIKNERSNWEKKGITIVLIHPSSKASGEVYLTQFDLLDVPSIADPECKIYEQFGLAKGSMSQLFGLSTFFRGFEVAAKGILPMVKQVGDGFQMPGIFIIYNGQIKDSYIHKSASDKPDYNQLIGCCVA